MAGFRPQGPRIRGAGVPSPRAPLRRHRRLRPGGILRDRILSALVLAPLAVAAIYLSEWSFAALVILAAAIGLWEWTRMCARESQNVAQGLALGAPLLAAPAVALVWLRHAHGTDAAMWLFGAVWATDIGAYAVGSLLRGPRIAPRVSPKKTWAGLIGGVVCAAAWAGGFGALAGIAGSPAALAAAGAALAVVAQAGDFAVSAAKRRFGLKDSSGLIPGHGGVLDRIAGLLTTGPALALLLLAINGDARSW